MKRKEFVRWLEERIQAEGGLRVSAEKAGVSHATLIRGMEGGTLTLRTLEGISKWTGVSLVRLLQMYGEEVPSDNQLGSSLARVIDEYPDLKDALLYAFENLSDEVVAEIVAYISFQVQRQHNR